MSDKKELVLVDEINSKITLKIGNPFLRDGTLWITSKISDEVILNVRISKIQVLKLFTFIEDWLKS